MNNFMNKVLEATQNGERRRAMEFDETTSLRFKENSAYDLLMWSENPDFEESNKDEFI